MKVILDLLDWSFVAVSFIIYIITQFVLGLIFVGEDWQVTSGTKYRLRKLLELGIPTLIGLFVGYWIVIPSPEAIQIDPIARCIYFGFAGGASPMIHTGVEAIFPSIVAKVGDYFKGLIPSNSSSTQSPPSPPAPPPDPNKKG